MHRLRSNILLALHNISLYRFRVALNLLGLIFGVSSVIVVRAIAEGAMAGAADHRLIALPATQSSAHKLAFSKDATYTILFASIAAIALLAGGIGIMNIMLATGSASAAHPVRVGATSSSNS
jgi:ABC-type antimicrobial peptide transport system permease subunit